MSGLIKADDRFFVAGSRGMAGSAICRALQEKGYGDEAKGGALLTPTRQELDLLNHEAVKAWYQANTPDVVVLAAAKVGGIYANDTYPADFLLENLKIQTNVIEGGWKAGVRAARAGGRRRGQQKSEGGKGGRPKVRGASGGALCTRGTRSAISRKSASVATGSRSSSRLSWRRSLASRASRLGLR